jgi:hypothetical protein
MDYSIIPGVYVIPDFLKNEENDIFFNMEFS